MFFEDLSNYRYYLPSSLAHVRNVGWLDDKHPFSKGQVDASLVVRLRELISGSFANVKVHVNQIRGQHPCNLCGSYPETTCADGGTLLLGSSEIWLPSPSGIFAAPSMVLHYIEMHAYRPPDEFIEALHGLDEKHVFEGQLEYQKLVEEIMTA